MGHEKETPPVKNSENHSAERLASYIENKAFELTHIPSRKFKKISTEISSAGCHFETIRKKIPQDVSEDFNLIGKTEAIFATWGKIINRAEELRKEKHG